MADEYQLSDNTGSILGENAKDAFDKTLKTLGDSPKDAPDNDLALTGLTADILAKYERAKTERLPHEQRWLRQYHNYRGLYQSDTQFRDTEQSKAFVKITKTKVMAAYSQIIDVLFQGDKFPLSVVPTEKPAGIAEEEHLDPQGTSSQLDNTSYNDIIGWHGDGKELAPGTTYLDLANSAASSLQSAPLVPGPSLIPQMPEIEPAKLAAAKMEKTILDQIDESDGHIWLRKSIFEMCLLGQGVLKGPFTVEKTYHDWEVDPSTGKRTYSPKYQQVPSISHVSAWNFYPDPDARIMKQAEWVIERHKLSRSEIRALAQRPFFRKNAISAVLDTLPNYVDQWWEYSLRDSPVNVSRKRYEVLEYWGLVDKKLIEMTGLDIGVELDDLEEVQVNVWLCNHEILRCVVNPFTPAKIPYHSCPYEEHEYQMWGIGVAENMEDSQEIMNAFARLAIDNAVLSSNLVFDIDETSLVPGQDFKVYPGKVFRRQAGQPGQSVFGLKFPNTFPDAMNVFDKFRQLADESTGIPSVMHGQTGVVGTGRTSSGLSMLMGAADKNIKAVIRNVDDYILQPLGEDFFNWNMQFNTDPSIVGDLDIKARGTSGLMAKEIKSQRLMQFLQICANPMLAPFAKFEQMIKDIAESLDLDPDEYTNDPKTAAIYAQIIGAAGGLGNSGVGSATPPGFDESGVGGGNSGTGIPQQPGTKGFQGSDQSANADSATG